MKRDNKVKIATTSYPPNRPDFKKWVKELGISQAAYELGEGKKRAEEIMKDVGIKPEPTFLEGFLGDY